MLMIGHITLIHRYIIIIGRLVQFMNLINHQIHLPATLKPVFLQEAKFFKRFIKKARLEDPFMRGYDICEDLQNNKSRVALKDYCGSTIKQRDDVFMNLQSYRSLQQIQGICKLISFCCLEQTGEIIAAFEYNDSTLQELIQAQFCIDNRKQFYLFILKELLLIFQNAKIFGIELDDLNPTNLLVYRLQKQFHIKILFDERQKRYDRLLEEQMIGQLRAKAYCSAESVKAAFGIGQGQIKQNQQFIFELGLMLLDIIYTYQMKCKGFEGKAESSFLIFQNSMPLLNHNLIHQHNNFLLSLNQYFLQELTALINRMVCPQEQRIAFEELLAASQQLLKLNSDLFQGKSMMANKEASAIKYNNSPQDSLKYSEQASVFSSLAKNILVETIPAKNVFIDEPKIQSRTTNFTQTSINYHFIPKSKILSQVNVHKNVKQELNKLITILQNIKTVTKKEYLDCSIYYGQLDPNTQKRQGLGMYFYTHGDIYFGKWKDNVLVDGTYIFRNGQCFEGVVKNGKQGWGRYYYSNNNIYEGDWKDDLKSGRGKMIYSNGDVYQGSWLKGKKNGEGTYFYHDGSIYKGSFSQGKKSGSGYIIFPNKTRVEAFWVDNHIQGKGKIFYNNGHYYDGEFYFSQKEGKGTYRWEDQTKYQGEFKKDKMLGEGKIIYLDNEYYQGRIENGKRSGFGIYKYPNGDQFKGQWKNDQKLIGQYKFYDGRLFDGKFKKNEMSYGVMIYENGDSYEGQFVNGQRHGQGLYRNSLREIIFDGKWAKDKFILNA